MLNPTSGHSKYSRGFAKTTLSTVRLSDNILALFDESVLPVSNVKTNPLSSLGTCMALSFSSEGRGVHGQDISFLSSGNPDVTRSFLKIGDLFLLGLCFIVFCLFVAFFFLPYD